MSECNMTIIQGGNSPMVFEFDEDITEVTDFSVTLCAAAGATLSKQTVMKNWKKEDMTVSTTSISCPITQSESAKFTPGVGIVEVKLIKDGTIVFFKNVLCKILNRNDREVQL